MANPKKQKTHSKSRMGRAHLALKKKTLNKCSKCGKAVLPHTACEFCGTYGGREVVELKNNKDKKIKK